jgi:hypothetical protein
MSRLVAASAVVLLVVATVGSIPAVGGAQQNAAVQTPDGFDRTTFRVTVYENGSARWAIEHRTPLNNESERQQFEDFAAEFERNETQLYANFVSQADVLTSLGTNTTGREMAAEGFQRSAGVDPIQSSGTVRMSFRWTNFAVRSGDAVVVNDVFTGGFYIGPSQSLVFERGPSLAFTEVQPGPDSVSQPDSLAESASVTWNGERSFNDRRPFVELGPRTTVVDGSNGTATPGDESPTTDGTPAPPTSGAPSWMFLVAGIVLLVGLGGAVAWRSGMGTIVLGGEDDTGGSEAVETEPEADSSAPAPEPDVTEDELLTDSDRVVKLLEDNGGRMKQVDIVDTTDWSKSKVSMLLSDMEDEGDISKLRVGRENIISLSGHEPDATKSPFDDE